MARSSQLSAVFYAREWALSQQRTTRHQTRGNTLAERDLTRGRPSESERPARADSPSLVDGSEGASSTCDAGPLWRRVTPLAAKAKRRATPIRLKVDVAPHGRPETWSRCDSASSGVEQRDAADEAAASDGASPLISVFYARELALSQQRTTRHQRGGNTLAERDLTRGRPSESERPARADSPSLVDGSEGASSTCDAGPLWRRVTPLAAKAKRRATPIRLKVDVAPHGRPETWSRCDSAPSGVEQRDAADEAGASDDASPLISVLAGRR